MSEVIADIAKGEVPDELAGPGRIVQRQTTYWEVRGDSGTTYRIHFKGKAETGFAGAEYPRVELTPSHPLLVHHAEPRRTLYFTGRPRDPLALATTLDRLIQDVSQGWRNLAFYAGDGRVLSSGFGNLMDAPLSLCAALAPVIEGAGLPVSIIGNLAGRPEHHVLLLGRSYVVARSFAFEPRA